MGCGEWQAAAPDLLFAADTGAQRGGGGGALSSFELLRGSGGGGGYPTRRGGSLCRASLSADLCCRLAAAELFVLSSILHQDTHNPAKAAAAAAESP